MPDPTSKTTKRVAVVAAGGQPALHFILSALHKSGTLSNLSACIVPIKKKPKQTKAAWRRRMKNV